MFRMMRVRLALSYAGIALLVTLALGAVLLVRLRAYYARIELDYLNSNAKAIGALAVPILEKDTPKEARDAQVSNLAFLSQTRVRILDSQQTVLVDSGPRASTKIGLGMMRTAKVRVRVNEVAHAEPAAVIVIQKYTGDAASAPGGAVSSTAEPQNQTAFPVPAGKQPPDVVFFNSSVSVSNGVYGLYLSNPTMDIGPRSDQKVLEPILDSNGSPLGYVELSEGPAYGREIVGSVASGLAVAGLLAILLAVAVGWWTSRRLVAPLLSVTEATRQMSGGDLSVRVAEADRKDEYGTLGKSFNQMAGRIEETVLTLRRFLSDAAHELQTPLTALRTNLELARNEANNPAAESHISLALEQIDRLQRLIKDLLNLSRLESGNGHETFQPVDLIELVQQVSEPFAARAEQAGQSFELDLPTSEGGSGPRVMGSPEKLRSALCNLLDNALKFTPAGGAVAVRLRETEGNVQLSVDDTGIGIPPEEIEMLFNRFHRARNASAYPGSGLGLAIVRAIAQAHGGRVEGMNHEHGGACFTLTLPLSR